MHTTLARQRAPKQSHYCPNTNYRIHDASPSGRSIPIGDSTQTNRQKTPNPGSIFPPNYGWYPCSATELISLISTKICSKSLHYIAKNLIFMQYLSYSFHVLLGCPFSIYALGRLFSGSLLQTWCKLVFA